MDVFTVALLQVQRQSHLSSDGCIGSQLRIGPIQQLSVQYDCPRICNRAKKNKKKKTKKKQKKKQQQQQKKTKKKKKTNKTKTTTTKNIHLITLYY